MDSLTAKIPASSVGLADSWYIATPAIRLTETPERFTVCGRVVTAWRESGMLRFTGGTLVEADGYIWAWNGEGVPTHAPHPLASRPGDRMHFEQGTVRWATGELDAIENTLDLIHTIFGHPVTHPAWWLHQLGIRPVVEVVVRPNALGFEADGHWGKLHLFRQVYTLPDRVYLRLLPAMPFKLDVYAHHVPEGPDAIRFEYMVGRSALWPGLVDRPGGRWLHHQDRELVEALTSNRPLGFVEQHCAADAYVLLYRKIRRLAAEGRWQEMHGRLSPLTVRIRL